MKSAPETSPKGASPHSPLGARAPVVLRPGRVPRLAKQVARLVRAAHLTAEDWRHFVRDVRRSSRIPPRARSPRPLPAVLTVEELRRMLDQAYAERPPGRGLILRVLFEMGIRVSELTALETTDVDLTERTCRVLQGKGGKDRIVVFTAELAQQLALHLGSRRRGPLFESNRHLAFSPRRIQQIVQGIAQRAGVAKRIHPHTYRHSMATFLRDRGMPLDAIQAQLGHADPRTTQIYVQLSVEERRREYDRAMTGLLGGTQPALEQ